MPVSVVRIRPSAPLSRFPAQKRPLLGPFSLFCRPFVDQIHGRRHRPPPAGALLLPRRPSRAHKRCARCWLRRTTFYPGDSRSLGTSHGTSSKGRNLWRGRPHCLGSVHRSRDFGCIAVVAPVPAVRLSVFLSVVPAFPGETKINTGYCTSCPSPKPQWPQAVLTMLRTAVLEPPRKSRRYSRAPRS